MQAPVQGTGREQTCSAIAEAKDRIHEKSNRYGGCRDGYKGLEARSGHETVKEEVGRNRKANEYIQGWKRMEEKNGRGPRGDEGMDILLRVGVLVCWQ